MGTVYWFSQDDLLRRLGASNRRFRRVLVAGTEVAVDVTDATGRLHYFYGEPYEPELTRAVVACLHPGDVFIDVGANIGFFSVLAAARVGPSGRVIAFEPHPGARAIFQQALGANGFADIVDVIPEAVGAAGAAARLFVTFDSVLSTVDPARAPLRDEYSFSTTVDVAMTSLDAWLAARPALHARLRAIKIDVEGTEEDVVLGLRNTLEARPPAHIFCETLADGPADRFLRSHGYDCVALDLRHDAFGNYAYTRSIF